MKKIRWILAKEGLILLASAVVIYVALLFLRDIPVVYPKYRLEFENGDVRTIYIRPEIRNDFDYKRLLREVHNPEPGLINKRIEEYRRMEGISPSLKEAKCVNTAALGISELYSSLLGVMFIFKVLIVYGMILTVRFIAWSSKALKEKR
jgi:hypothetical protein